jgi:glycosyltransferase involved in cell wall biosynthesis
VAGPLVSIVTPSFNQAAFLEEALCSVLEQDYPRVEYLVVDGGSTDGSVEIVRRYEDRLAWWTSEPDDGQADALNKGFARANGEILGWVSSDDTLLPGTVARLVERFERDPDLLLVYGDALYTDEVSARTGYLPSRPYDVGEMVRRCECYVVQPGSLFRRRAWELAGPFDPTRHWFFDFELFVRVGRHGRVERVQEPLATYRVHPGSKSFAGYETMARDYVRVADEFYSDGLFRDELAGLEREARSSAYLQAGENFYAALDLASARSCFARALRLHPRNASRRSLSLLAKSLLPLPLVRSMRRRRSGRPRPRPERSAPS